jgi:hypothetical protein
MADVVTSQTVFDGDRVAIMKFTNVSDGTGETSVTKVTASSLNPNQFGLACNGVSLEKIHVSVNGMSVNIIWGGTPDLSAFIAAPGTYTFDFSHLALPDNATTATGNIKFTTIGAAASKTYTIVLQMVKHYAAPKP